MNKKMMTATKTIGAVMAVGGAAAMIGSAMSNKKSTKKQMVCIDLYFRNFRS